MTVVAGAAVIVLAAGSGSRVGAEINKILLPIGARPVLAYSVRTALEVPGVDRVVVVHRPGEAEAVAEAIGPELGEREVLLVEGGASRHASETAALAALDADIEAGRIDVVAIHDGARPLAPAQLFIEAIRVARESGGAVPVVRLAGLLPRPGIADPRGSHGDLTGVQTPQAFRAEELRASYLAAAREGFEGTDTAACLERYGRDAVAVLAVAGTPMNLKVTYAEDIATAEALLEGRPAPPS